MREAECGAPIWVPERNKKGALGEGVAKQEISTDDNYEKDSAEADSRGMYS